MPPMCCMHHRGLSPQPFVMDTTLWVPIETPPFQRAPLAKGIKSQAVSNYMLGNLSTEG